MTKTLYAIGVDLGGTKIEAALIGLDGTLQHQTKQPTKVEEGIDATIQQIADLIQEIKNKTSQEIQGVGIGIAGQIDASGNVVLFAPNLKWKNVAIKKHLESLFPFPIYIDNDVRVATRGEKDFGAGKGCTNFICLFLGTGIGGGIVIDNHLYSGATHTAGEFGHMVVQMDGPLCTCGNYGCLEAFSSGWALAKKAQDNLTPDSLLFKLSDGNKEKITAALVYQAAQQNDSLALQIVQLSTKALIAGTTSIVNAWNPKRIIFGGGQLKGYPGLIEKIKKGIREQALEAASKEIEIVASGCKNNASLWGGASLVFESLSQPSIR